MPRRDWKNEDFDQSIKAKGRKKMKIRVIGPGFVQDYPNKAACAAGLKVSPDTVDRAISSGKPYGEVIIKPIRSS